MPYDGGFDLPAWWLARYRRACDQLGWKNPRVIEEARRVDPRKQWGADRLVKMEKERRATLSLVIAVSAALQIPYPVVLPADEDEAEALRAWLASRRRLLSSESAVRRAAVAHALEIAVETARDQTPQIPSGDEGTDRSGGTRRATRRR